ncbi:MAG TPA: hypothetical protein DCO77_07490 [Nitrospiraceae bacterium]|nr:hypothetical protein [Nitrospiraceae bacterium]
MIGGIYRNAFLIAALFCLFLFGCVSHTREQVSKVPFADSVSRYRQADETLSIGKLTRGTSEAFAHRHGTVDISILVHPAYSVFIDGVTEKNYSDAMFNLLRHQFESESGFIEDQAQAGEIVILILPAGSVSRTTHHLSYTSYLNRVSSSGNSVLYLFSRSASSGSLARQDMLALYHFLRSVNPRRVLIGGGYIGRCQEEFFHQFVTYFDGMPIFFVPEISTISPKDLSASEASGIVKSIERHDYGPVKAFISSRTDGVVNFLSIPQKTDVHAEGS